MPKYSFSVWIMVTFRKWALSATQPVGINSLGICPEIQKWLLVTTNCSQVKFRQWISWKGLLLHWSKGGMCFNWQLRHTWPTVEPEDDIWEQEQVECLRKPLVLLIWTPEITQGVCQLLWENLSPLVVF